MFESPFNIMVECAKMDTSIDSENVMKESAIRQAYSAIPEVDEFDSFTAEMVAVEKIGNDYMVESYCIMPFMQSNNIKSVGEALDYVAEANGLPRKSVGLLLESDESVECTINNAIAASQESGKSGTKNSTFKKITKVEDLTKNLTNKGYKVKKKKNKK